MLLFTLINHEAGVQSEVRKGPSGELTVRVTDIPTGFQVGVMQIFYNETQQEAALRYAARCVDLPLATL